MQADPTVRKRPIRKPRKGPSDHLRDALHALSDGYGEPVSHAERPWASITFSGSRHNFTYMFEGTEALSAAEQLIDRLADHEFTIPGQLVADANVTAVEQTMLPSPRMEVSLEILLLEDC